MNTIPETELAEMQHNSTKHEDKLIAAYRELVKSVNVWKESNESLRNAVEEIVTNRDELKHRLGMVEQQRDEYIKEIEGLRAHLNALANLHANIADTCRSRGFAAGFAASKPLDERVIELAQRGDNAIAQVAALKAQIGKEGV